MGVGLEIQAEVSVWFNSDLQGIDNSDSAGIDLILLIFLEVNSECQFTRGE